MGGRDAPFTDAVVLCEDQAHAMFARRVLERFGCGARRVTVLALTGGRGSGEQFVRRQLPRQLRALRSSAVNRLLVVVIDGDGKSVRYRLDQLAQACHDAGVEPPGDADRVLTLVPRLNIETWCWCLLCESPSESEDYSAKVLPPGAWTQAAEALFVWSRPNAEVPIKCVSALRESLRMFRDLSFVR